MSNVIMPNTDIVASSIEDFKSELRQLVEKGVEELIIDLTRVTMVDSVGLGVLIATHNSLKNSIMILP